MKRGISVVIGVVAWVSAIGVGVAAMWRYETGAGELAAAPSLWPSASTLPAAAPGRARLVMFVHPQCPCSKASLGELRAVVAAVGDRATTTIAFIQPDGVGADWLDTATWDAAAEIRGATLVIDRGGVEAARFGARTSSHVVVYDAGGALAFAGGITAARGHAGDNVGRRQVIDLIRHGRAAVALHAVFGCPLGEGAP